MRGLAQGLPAGDAEHLAVHVARLVVGEEYVRRRQLRRLRGTLHRIVLAELLVLLHALALVGGVVDEDVDAPEFAGRLLRQRLARAIGIEIPGREQGAAPRRLDREPGHVRVLVLREIGDDDVGAFAREGQRHRAADPAVRAGDEGYLVLQPAEPAIRRFPVIRAGIHLALLAGKLLGLRRKWRLWSLLFRVGHTRTMCRPQGTGIPTSRECGS